MKQFLLNCRVLRNTCSVVLCCVATIILVMGAGQALSEFLHHGRLPIDMYEAFWQALSYNVVGGVLMGAGLIVYSEVSKRKVWILATAGICGMLSFMLYGFIAMLYGLIAGKVLGALGIFFFTAYASVALMFGTRIVNCHIWKKLDEKKGAKEVSAENMAEFVL